MRESHRNDRIALRSCPSCVPQNGFPSLHPNSITVRSLDRYPRTCTPHRTSIRSLLIEEVVSTYDMVLDILGRCVIMMAKETGGSVKWHEGHSH